MTAMYGRAETIRGLHVERGHAERAVAEVAQHLFLRMREFRRHGEAGSDAERSRARRGPSSDPGGAAAPPALRS